MAVVVDPAFYLELALPDLGRPEVVESDGETVLRLRYHYTGQLDAIARALLGNRPLTWLQEVRLDPKKRSGRLGFSFEDEPERLHGDAELAFVPDASGSSRRLDGEMVVSVPLVGAMAERHVVAGVIARLEIEADAIGDVLRDRGARLPPG